MFLKKLTIAQGGEDTAHRRKDLFRAVTEYRVLIQTDPCGGGVVIVGARLQIPQAGGSLQQADLSLAP